MKFVVALNAITTHPFDQEIAGSGLIARPVTALVIAVPYLTIIERCLFSAVLA
jgi:hypothetical protein